VWPLGASSLVVTVVCDGATAGVALDAPVALFSSDPHPPIMRRAITTSARVSTGGLRLRSAVERPVERSDGGIEYHRRAHVLGCSVSTASHHLQKLRDLKLLKNRTDGKMAYYSLRDDFAAKLVAQVLRRGES
jgi:DNA-binding transcriptional ArsR family regulator